jgi:hypothetical protein
MTEHMVSNRQKEGFKKVLENVGKIKKKVATNTVDNRVAYKAFVEEHIIEGLMSESGLNPTQPT